jgi:hypothetical protein
MPNWLPTVVPYGADQTVYLVFDNFGASRSDCPEKEIEREDQVAEDIQARCDIDGVPVPEHVRDFVASHTGLRQAGC